MEPFGRIKLSSAQKASLITPGYIVNECRIEENLQILDEVQKAAGCKILLAFKGFAMWSLADIIRKYLPGISASSVNEAMLAQEKFGGELHVYAPAYSDEDIDRHLQMADHLVLNSLAQWTRFRSKLSGSPRKIRFGLRINPEHSETETPLYDPSAPFSRLGVTRKVLEENHDQLEGLSGFHFHNLCELNSDALERTLKAVEEKFGRYFSQISWINFGGGHHITRNDYDVDKLVRLIRNFRQKYALEVYLEPGEAIALNTGILATRVLDIIHNDRDIAILDCSATAHMPDVLEMPYIPPLEHSAKPGELQHNFRLGGLTCLAGDVIGDYSFEKPLKPGDLLSFGDMAHYTMVKNTTFNGVNLPAIYLYNDREKTLRLIRRFGYEDYKNRLS